jgi:acetoin utilization protein AcuC
MDIAIIYSEGLIEYDFGPGHPFRGNRYTSFMEHLNQYLTEGKDYKLYRADYANDEDLLLICNKDYIEATREIYRAAHSGIIYPRNFSMYQSGDNLPYNKPGRIEEAARLVIGQAKLAADLVQSNTIKKAISIGGGLHHAKPHYGEGFCLYNDVAYCAKYLLENYNLDKILILDTDAHAGNGTCEYFYEEPRVLFIDIHQDPRTLYPGTGFVHQIGRGKGEGFTVNIPMPPFAGDASYELAFDEIIFPLVNEFQPQIIIRNGGSDPHYNDHLTNLSLTLQGFNMIGTKVRLLSEICNGKEIDLIASGYNQEVLPYAWLSLISSLINKPLELTDPSQPLEKYFEEPVEETKYILNELKKTLSYHWKCFK